MAEESSKLITRQTPLALLIGCAVGTGTYLKSKNPAVKVVGYVGPALLFVNSIVGLRMLRRVCNVFGDPTPGPRHFPNFESSPFPWRETIDSFEDVSSVDSY